MLEIMQSLKWKICLNHCHQMLNTLYLNRWYYYVAVFAASWEEFEYENENVPLYDRSCSFPVYSKKKIGLWDSHPARLVIHDIDNDDDETLIQQGVQRIFKITGEVKLEVYRTLVYHPIFRFEPHCAFVNKLMVIAHGVYPVNQVKPWIQQHEQHELKLSEQLDHLFVQYAYLYVHT